jgi:hypothetical protein
MESKVTKDEGMQASQNTCKGVVVFANQILLDQMLKKNFMKTISKAQL